MFSPPFPPSQYGNIKDINRIMHSNKKGKKKKKKKKIQQNFSDPMGKTSVKLLLEKTILNFLNILRRKAEKL